MTIAVNDAGDVLTLDNGAWKPAVRAVNDKTGESLVLDGGAWKPMPTTPKQDAAPSAPTSEFGDLAAQPWAQGDQPADNARAPVARIADAAAQAWKDTPEFIAPPAREALNQYGGTGPFGAGEFINQVGHGVTNVIGAAHAGAAALSQTVMEMFGEKGGRDALALLSTLPMANGERMSPEVAAPAPTPAGNPRFISEVTMPPDTVGLTPLHRALDLIRHDDMENGTPAPDRGAPNQGTTNALDVMNAPDIDGAIATAQKAVASPYVPVTATQVAARDGVDINEAYRRAAAENAAGVSPAATDSGQPVAPVPALTTPTPPTRLATQAAATEIPKTSADAKQIASAYYQMADQVGGALTPEFTNKFIDKAESIAPQTTEGQIITGESPITSLIDRIQELRDQSISLQGAQEIDEGLGSLIDKEFGVKGLTKEGKNLLDLQTTFRNMILDAGPEDTVGGTGGFEALKQGRAAWAQAMKMTDLERILDRAELTDNPATSIRSGIRTLLSNPARARGYTPEEISALQDAADRGPLGAMLHVFGSRLVPLAAGGAGGATAGFEGAMLAAGAAHGASTLMRNAASSLQTKRIGNAMSVLGGGVPPAP